MRILHVVPTMSPAWGGPTTVVQQLCPDLMARGHATEIVCMDRPDSRWIGEAADPGRDPAPPVHMLGPGVGKYGYSGKFIPWIRSNAKKFDCVIVHGLWQYISQATRRALLGLDTPYFIYPHGGLGLWFRHAHPIKHVKKAVYWSLVEHRVMRDARAVFFACDEERRQAGRLFRPYRCNEAILNFGIAGPTGDHASQRRSFLAKFPGLEDRRLLVHVSRIDPQKACDVLIEAFAAVADEDQGLHLVMVGPNDSGWAVQLRQRAAALGLGPRVTWTGTLAGDLKWGAFHAATAFVFPSRYESFGVAAVEALACGRPVLVSDQVPIWREIEADRAGLVSQADRPGTERLLRSWIASRDAEKAAMGRNARRCFAERFEVQRATESLLQALRSHGVAG